MRTGATRESKAQRRRNALRLHRQMVGRFREPWWLSVLRLLGIAR